MKSGRSLIELARELERQVGTKKDLLVPLPRTQYRTAEDGECALEIEEPTGVQRYGITALARRQLAEKLKIPYAYFERMRTEQPELLDRNVNAWLSKRGGRASAPPHARRSGAGGAVGALPALGQPRPRRARAAGVAAHCPMRGSSRSS